MSRIELFKELLGKADAVYLHGDTVQVRIGTKPEDAETIFVGLERFWWFQRPLVRRLAQAAEDKFMSSIFSKQNS